ncbi:LacI family DNA-binding transcriptional regulator [Paenibacillus cremeus]|uniref:LacI family transcriptional regulator n=1 Tax=Paenibacillus cremeus TaxID=2163881 RepID=A0A559K9R3_9BACL|nr:LacI family DNA-binding transcriptional regulator [Paenibacillus cremeus]TVY08833.1 LacI family transcriptional regulator [Paenibacillus cremeus]
MSIREIAKRTGVSVSTVSRALNNYADVNQETRLKIMQVAEELNYFPNSSARSLVMRKTHLIALFCGDQISSNFDAYIQEINAVRTVAGNAGYDLLIFSNRNKERATYATLCRERSVDGAFLILNREEKKKKDQIAELERLGVPCVTVNFKLDGERCSYAECDNFQGTKDAVLHLIGLGHRKIGFIGGDTYGKAGVDRVNGYISALHETGILLDSQLMQFGYFTENGAREAAKKIMDTVPDVTAIFVASDTMALTVIDILRSRGLQVPEDISIVGFGDTKEGKYAQPPLTTVNLMKYEQGKLATEFLIRMIEDPKEHPAPVTFPCQLIVRGSTDYAKS